MFEGLNHIILSGEEYPIKCDLIVLEKIQDEFGSVGAFERKILNWEKTEKEGVMRGKNPDTHAINFALPLMVNEGIIIENDTAEEKRNAMDAEAILRKVDMDIVTIAGLIHKEFARCFPEKKLEAQKDQKTKKTV